MSLGELNLSIQSKHGVPVLHVSGAIDSSNIDAFKKNVKELCEKGDSFVMNCRDLTFINSTAMGTLFHFNEKCTNKNLQMILCHVAPPILSIMKILNLDSILDIENGLDEAIQRVRKSDS